MKKDFTKICWSCGSKDLESDSHGVKCRKCGATYNKIPSIAASSLAIENDPRSNNYVYGNKSMGHPGPGSRRDAARARDNSST